MIVKLLTEHHLESLSLKGSCTDSSESTLVKMPHCWKPHAMAQIRSLDSIDDGNITTVEEIPDLCSDYFPFCQSHANTVSKCISLPAEYQGMGNHFELVPIWGSVFRG